MYNILWKSFQFFADLSVNTFPCASNISTTSGQSKISVVLHASLIQFELQNVSRLSEGSSVKTVYFERVR